MGGDKQWMPLESNPEVMDTYMRGCVAHHTAHTTRRTPHGARHFLTCVHLSEQPAARRLGFPATYVFHDVYGFDPDLLAMARALAPRYVAQRS